MSKATLWDMAHEFIGKIGWRMFLWGIRQTETQYWAGVEESIDSERQIKAHEETEFWDEAR